MSLVVLLLQARSADRPAAEAAFGLLYRRLTPVVDRRLAGFSGQLDRHELRTARDEAALRVVFGRSGARDGGARAPDLRSDAAIEGYAATTAYRAAIDLLRARGAPVPTEVAEAVAGVSWVDVGRAEARLTALEAEFLAEVASLHPRNEQILLFAWSAWRRRLARVPWSAFVRDNPVLVASPAVGVADPATARRLADLVGSLFDVTLDVVPMQGPHEAPEAALARAEALVAAALSAGAPATRDPSRRPGRPTGPTGVDVEKIEGTPTIRAVAPRVASASGLAVEVREGAWSQSAASAAHHFKSSGARWLLARHLLRLLLDEALSAVYPACGGERLARAVRHAQAARVNAGASTPEDSELLELVLADLRTSLGRAPATRSARARDHLAELVLAVVVAYERGTSGDDAHREPA
jgi:hypothetical protein